jgi:hypothetical protein
MVALAMILATATIGHAQTISRRDSLKGVEIGVRGCVKPGLDRGSVVLDRVFEVARDGKLLPQPAPGLPTAVYSFDDSSSLRSHMGQMVEVRGRIKDIRDSEIEVKPAKDADGQLVAELPIEGPNVRATLDEVPLPIGTSGRSSLKSVVLLMAVDSVSQVSASCAR